ncbi:leucine-rich repeat neuronal protein 2-like [Pararge aegeria]|uniref:Jg20278 protein n=1 Tax=Pararge aegeria aegeria TaxID=348720 RepID=A0A8S4SJX5_9NEOP|nr:leucine-rich repeat neuronal protein 2-like [Pararge aegeria]CAH2269576.1 jg20278 [Pararge aegeria aegeria]
MRLLYTVLAIVAYSFKAESSLVCDSDFCVCHHNNKSDREVFGEIIDCSYDPNLLRRNFSLPETAYTLNLSRNNLTKIQFSLILKSETLAELLLNSNQINEIALNALRLANLKRLDLSDNKLEVIHAGTFDHINNLEYLNLANNKFATFEKISFHHLGELQEIVLDNNNLGPSLEDNNLFDRSGYGLTHKIQALSMSGINLENVYDNFFVDAYNLKRLTISNNKLTDTFEFPFTLEYLDISDNPINEISEEDFIDLVGLKELKLNNLQIKEISGYTFASLHSLTSLELERNKNLVNFSAEAFGKEVLDDADYFPLETLSFKGSRLTSLDQELEVPFGQLIRLDLQGNFWNCNCNLKWIKKLQIHPEDYDHLRCYTPKPLYNSRIFELDEKYFNCATKDRSRHIVVTISIVSFCLLLSSLAVWVYMFMPRSQTRCDLANMYSGAGYSVLPMHVSTLRSPL